MLIEGTLFLAVQQSSERSCGRQEGITDGSVSCFSTSSSPNGLFPFSTTELLTKIEGGKCKFWERIEAKQKNFHSRECQMSHFYGEKVRRIPNEIQRKLFFSSGSLRWTCGTDRRQSIYKHFNTAEVELCFLSRFCVMKGIFFSNPFVITSREIMLDKMV
jgi:hypothetical protein